MNKDNFDPWLNRWMLIPDGLPFVTHTSQLIPVKTSIDGIKTLLKITDDPEEQRGNAQMVWWEGSGAAQVLGHENEVILLERATGSASLSALSRKDRMQRLAVLCALQQTGCIPARNSLYHNLLLFMNGSAHLNQPPVYMVGF